MPAHHLRRSPNPAARQRTRVLRAPSPLLLMAALVATTGCTARSPARTSSSVPLVALTGVSSVVARPQDIIERSQLLATGEASMYDALRQLRSELFRPRSAPDRSAEDALPAVYINEFYQGNLEILRGLTTDVVRDVQLVRSLDTSMRFGRAHPAGALMVRLQLR